MTAKLFLYARLAVEVLMFAALVTGCTPLW